MTRRRDRVVQRRERFVTRACDEPDPLERSQRIPTQAAMHNVTSPRSRRTATRASRATLSLPKEQSHLRFTIIADDPRAVTLDRSLANLTSSSLHDDTVTRATRRDGENPRRGVNGQKLEAGPVRVELQLLRTSAQSGPPDHRQNYDFSLIPPTEFTNQCNKLEMVRGFLGQNN